MEPLLPLWPPELNAQGDPYPSDALDEWSYRLGVNYALLGEVNTARDLFTRIAEEPSTKNSRWIKPARKFLKTYQNADDVYRACVDSEFCEPAFAIQYLLETLPDGQDALTYLRSSGVNTFATGFFDFDDDDVREQWFTVRHRPHESLEFWILASYPAGVKPLFVSVVNSRTPQLDYLDPAYVSPEALNLQPVVMLDSKIAFSMQRAPETIEPYLVDVPLRQEYPNRFKLGVELAEGALFSGVSPGNVKNELLSIAEWPGLLCEPTWSCDPYLYLLGLSSELASDESAAVKAYCQLWSDYSKSPYTTMARMKLVGGEAPPTATPTLTLTFTPTIVATPSPFITSVSTATFTPTVTGTPPTLTPTSTGTLTTDTPTITLTLSTAATPQPSDTPIPTQTTGPYPVPTTVPTFTPPYP